MLIKTDRSDAIMCFLKQEFLINQNIIGIIENVPTAEIYVDDIYSPRGVLVNKDGYMHYLYTTDDEFIDNVCENYFKEGFFGFSGVEGKLAEKIRQRYLLGWESPCTLYYMPSDKLDLTLKKNPTERIRLADAEIVDHFYQYRNPGTLEVIKRDITNRPSSAIYINDEIACWVLIHDDNSMGIMYTKEEHRRKGYAVDVSIDLADQIIKAGKLPFIQIVKGNGMSPGLAAKCGFVEAGKADWFGIVAGTPKEMIEANEMSRQSFLSILPEALHTLVNNKNKRYIGLYNVLHSFKYQSYTMESIELVKVENEKDKKLWCEIIINSNQLELEASKVEAMLLNAAADTNCNSYILFKAGIAIAASTTHRFDEEDRGLYLLSVISEYKDTDILKILINETIQTEKSSGCYFIAAQAEESTGDIFKEISFRESHIIG